MAKRQQYVKLGAVSLIPGTQFSGVSARNTVVGARVVGDFMEDGQRVLLLERQGDGAAPKTRKPRTTNAKATPTPQPATAFPGEVAGRG